MGDLLSNSVSGLLAFQRALNVTSNNVSNSATPGYSVERVNLIEQPSQASPAGFFGNGVDVASITRAYDNALAAQVRSSQSSYSSSNAFATQAAQLDNMLSSTSTGLSASLQNFVNSLQNVANSPSSTAVRQTLLSQAQSLAQQLQSYSSRVSQYGSDVDSQLGNTVSQINSIASSIAALNSRIADAERGVGQTPNDLLDQRDVLLDQLSQYVGVSTSSQSDGEVNVYIGTGQPLVTSGTAQQLTTVQDPYDASRHNIGITTPAGSSDVTSQITGGTLGGLLSVRAQILDPVRNTLGQISVGLATLVNQQQQSGMDLTGAMGSPMFSVGAVQTLSPTTNTGSATIAVARTSLSALTTDDYRLQMIGGSWKLLDTTTGQTVTMTGSGTAASPFQAAGLSIVVNGAAANADSFAIRPTAAAAAGLSVLLTNPSQIAAAAPIRTAAGASNTGTATISSGAVIDPTNPQLLATTTIQFTSGPTYQINGTSYPYTSGAPITVNGWSVTISGTPAVGDTFTVASNAGGTGDNRNALLMANALSSHSLASGTTSLIGAANNLVSQVGVSTQSAQSSAAAQKAVNQDAVTSRNNVSGVNLDEEAANLVRYQQAYQACAQLIQASNTTFNSLLAAFRG